MAAHSSVLAWRIPGLGEPGGLLPMGSHRVGHDWSDSAAAAATPPTKGSNYWFISPLTRNAPFALCELSYSLSTPPSPISISLFFYYLFIWLHQVLVCWQSLFHLSLCRHIILHKEKNFHATFLLFSFFPSFGSFYLFPPYISWYIPSPHPTVYRHTHAHDIHKMLCIFPYLFLCSHIRTFVSFV